MLFTNLNFSKALGWVIDYKKADYLASQNVPLLYGSCFLSLDHKKKHIKDSSCDVLFQFAIQQLKNKLLAKPFL